MNDDIDNIRSNPYIDYNLLNQQKAYSPTQNRQFESKHSASLNSLTIQVYQ